LAGEGDSPRPTPRLPRSLRLKKLAPFILLLWLATFLRFHNLDAQSFWNDEGNSARLSERSIRLIIEGTASDIHPPLYYLLLRGWREPFGETEFALRALSAFAGLLMVPLAIALAKNRQWSIVNGQWSMGRRPLTIDHWLLTIDDFPWVVGLLTAVSPPLIYYSQEARMYALLGLLATLSSLLLLRILDFGFRNAAYKLRLTLFVAYVATAVAGLYTHYFFPAILVAHNLIVVLWLVRNWKRSKLTIDNCQLSIVNWFALMLAVFLLYLPWMPTFLANVGGGGAVARPPFLPFLADVAFWLGFGATIEATAVPWPFIALGLLLVLGVVFNRSWETAVWLILLFVPILFLYASGAAAPQYYKFLTAVIVPFVLVAGCRLPVASATGHQPPATRYRPPATGHWLLLLLYLFGVTESLQNLYADPAYARADYRGLAARIAAENRPNAGVILNAPNQWEVFTYYHTDGPPVYPLPLQGMTAEAVAAELATIAARHDRLYVIYWGDGQQDPERRVERWLDENSFKATEEWVQDLRFVVYAVPGEAATEMVVRADVPFGEAITLEGYTLGPTTLSPGEIAQVTLFWQTAVSLSQRYKVFLHLVGADGRPVAQRDSEPGGNLKPTTIWPPGETISDNHGLLIPADLPPGDYTLLLGLYDLADPAARLPVGGETAVNNALPLTRITINR
jgi:mannosyltransferase